MHTRAVVLATIFGLTACGGTDPLPQDVPDPGGMTPDSPVGVAQRPSNRECVAPEFAASGDASIDLVDAFPNLPAMPQLLYLLQSPDGNAWYALRKTGQLLRFANDPVANSLTTALDLSGVVATTSEQGLLGMAFHPNFASNNLVYLYYSVTGQSRVSRFTANADGTLDADSELVVLEVAQFRENHNGGTISFGPDGFLYLGLGDGGGANDDGGNGNPGENGENPNTLLGSMLRIDVDNPSGGRNYGIPADNPFADGNGGAPEVYAFGLRNPYRWSFDSLNGDLWLADVGQGSFEEIDIIVRGGNYGWNTMEGFACFDPANGCVVGDRILPVAAYPRSAGVSVTGGHVYRGSDVPGLRGLYLFGDFAFGNIWAIDRNAGSIDESDAVLQVDLNIAAFAQDADGEMYVIDFDGGAGTAIQRIVAAGPATPSDDLVAQQLSETGCVNMSNPRIPAAGTVSFAPNAPFWSDGAIKYRAAALPDGGTLSINEDGDFLLPTGSVLIKHFELGGEIFETRLFYNHADGWQGYSYRWNEQRTEATLLTTSLDEEVAGQLWHYPSRGECDACHTDAANVSLGPEAQQLNGVFTYPESNVEANQLDTLEHINWVDRPLNDSDYVNPLPDPNVVIADNADAQLQTAKSYLHTNCSQCHRPDSPVSQDMDLRFNTALADMGICNVGSITEPDRNRVTPGDAANSVLVEVMRSQGDDRMPPIARNVVDTQGVAVLENWINNLAACP